MRYFFLLLVLLFGATQAQDAQTGPAAVADRAVREWLAREPLNPLALSSGSPEEVCRELPALLANPAPPAGTAVNFGNRVERPGEGAARRYTYPVTFPGERLAVLEVTLKRQDGRWQAERVGVQSTVQGPTIPAVLQGPAAAWDSPR